MRGILSFYYVILSYNAFALFCNLKNNMEEINNKYMFCLDSHWLEIHVGCKFSLITSYFLVYMQKKHLLNASN